MCIVANEWSSKFQQVQKPQLVESNKLEGLFAIQCRGFESANSTAYA